MQHISTRLESNIPKGASLFVPENSTHTSSLWIIGGTGELWIQDRKSRLFPDRLEQFVAQPHMEIRNTGEAPLKIILNLWNKE